MLPSAAILSIVSTHRRALRLSKAVALALALMASPSLEACGSGSGGTGGGIHARMGYSESEGLRVVEVPPNGAAAAAGLLVDDRIIAIDEESVRAMNMTEVVESLRGAAGTYVVLDFVRDGETFRIQVMRTPYAGTSTP